MTVVPIRPESDWHDFLVFGRDGATDVLAIVCTRCQRDVVYVRVFEDDARVEFVTRWLGCDCKPQRNRLSSSDISEIVKRRFDTATQIHLESWGEKP